MQSFNIHVKNRPDRQTLFDSGYNMKLPLSDIRNLLLCEAKEKSFSQDKFGNQPVQTAFSMRESEKTTHFYNINTQCDCSIAGFVWERNTLALK